MHAPVKGRDLDVDDQSRSMLLPALRALVNARMPSRKNAGDACDEFNCAPKESALRRRSNRPIHAATRKLHE